MEIWSRPWGLFAPHRRHVAADGLIGPDAQHQGCCWLYAADAGAPRVAGRRDLAEPVDGFSLSDRPRQLALLPLPARLRPPIRIEAAGNGAILTPGCVPERFRGEEPRTEEERVALGLFRRAEDVWDRLSEVETALADPATLWPTLEQLWRIDEEEREPRMDVIVRHARQLRPVLEALERAPRRILRRTHRMLPISRMQEMDRRAMTWLVRQPGETMAERAGNSQRLLGVAREENFDTLENRVLRAYLGLARQHARDYLERHHSKTSRKRHRSVREFRAQVMRIDRQLRDAAVREAEPGVTPNYVLLANPRYRKVWDAWEELREKHRVDDERWRWQGRSWEEFCALQVMVALHAIPGARLIAASPLAFRDEQRRGSWVESVNPMGVFHLPAQRLVVEVQYRTEKPGTWRADLAAPIWLRCGRIDNGMGFQNYLAIWPLWSMGDIDPRDVADLQSVVDRMRPQGLRAAFLLQPAPVGAGCSSAATADVAAIATGSSGAPLGDGINALQQALLRHLGGRRA